MAIGNDGLKKSHLNQMGIIEGPSGYQAEVTSSNELKVIGPSAVDSSGNPSTAGNYITLVCEADAGVVTGSVTQRQADISAYYRQRVGVDTVLFAERFLLNSSAANVNPHTANWTVSATLTNALSGFTLNSALGLTTNAYSILRTRRVFTVYDGYPLQFSAICTYNQASNALSANVTVEFGFGQAATNAASTDGAFFRYDGTTMRCVVNVNGSESVVTPSGTYTPTVNVAHTYLVVVTNAATEFWVDNLLYANIAAVPLANVMPAYYRLYNGGSSPAVGVSLSIYSTSVTLGDMLSGRTWPEIQAGSGLHCSQFFLGAASGASIGTTATYSNSLAAGAGVVLTNTTVATTGLGGQIGIQPTLAAGTDGIVCGYQLVAATNALVTRNLFITGITIHGAVTAALTGGPVLWAYSMFYGNTAISMATAESASAKAPRRIPLGFETYPAASAAGVIGGGIDRVFTTPVLVSPGEFVGVCAKNLGTVTSAGVIVLLVRFDGYWD
mgnify:CR=1 FL=1